MNIQPYIISDLDIRSIGEKIEVVKKLFKELSYSHLPVASNGVYLGSISENDVQIFESEKTIADYQYALESFFVRETDDWLEVLHSFAQNQTNILPVLDEHNTYVGVVELVDIMNLFTETPFLNEPGGIIILEKGYKDYSFSEVSQIIESNDGHLLGTFLSKTENDVVQITLKIGQTGLNAILQSFRRYGYRVLSHHQEDTFRSNLRERSDYLDKYLNV